MKWFDVLKTRMIYLGRMFRLLWQLDKILLFIIIGEVVILTFPPFITMYLIKFSIDMLTAGDDFASYLPTVLILLGIELVVNTIGNILAKRRDFLGNTFGVKLFCSLFEKTLKLDYDMLLDKEIMEKRQMAFKVVDQGKFYDLIRDFNSFVRNLLVICGIAYIIAQIESLFLFVVVLIVIINSALTARQTRLGRDIWEQMAPSDRKLRYFISIDTDTSFAKEIRLYKMQTGLSRMLHEVQAFDLSLFGKNVSFMLFSSQVQYITAACLKALIYSYLGFKVLVQRLITVGDFSLYLSAITTFNSAIQEMISSFIAISDSGRYLKDYFDYMEFNSRYNTIGRQLPEKAAGELTFAFENVSFRYPYQTEASVKNISLTLSNRERLAIVGENGAGKTTLIKLLMRLFEPTEGRILLNGIDIKEINYDQYLSLFASVFQDFKLFAFRIADNITSLLDGAEDGVSPAASQKIRECLDKAGLLEKIDSLNKGLDTYLYKLYEEDGVELSGGEAQKLAIARALYKDAPVIILDEPTAALDPRSEYEIYTRFFEMVANKTSVFITHRLSSTRFCDRIIVLKNGEIVETGTHEELLAKNSYYAELFNMQAQFYTDTKSGGEPVEQSAPV
jgi:ABC-type multidrug transport system fused ATPase/permease subunit